MINLINNKDVYLCDPQKNPTCKKSWCFIKGRDCKLTSKKECSVNGEPYYKRFLNELVTLVTRKSDNL